VRAHVISSAFNSQQTIGRSFNSKYQITTKLLMTSDNFIIIYLIAYNIGSKINLINHLLIRNELSESWKIWAFRLRSVVIEKKCIVRNDSIHWGLIWRNVVRICMNWLLLNKPLNTINLFIVWINSLNKALVLTYSSI